VDAGVPTVVDKPLAPTVGDARRLIETARRRNVPLTVFHNRRWDGDFLTLTGLCAAHRLGTVHRFESRFERWRPVRKDTWRERPDRDQAGGLLFDLGAHLIDQAVQLLGPVARVFAELDRRREGAEVDDDSFILTHRGGARSHLWVSQTAAHHGPRFRTLGSRAAYVKWGLDGQEAALARGVRPGDPAWGHPHPDEKGELHSGGDVSPVPTEPGRYTDFYERMRDALRHGTPVPVDPEDAVTGLAIIEAAQRSDRERTVVWLST
jgi:predicted dehydrogenase